MVNFKAGDALETISSDTGGSEEKVPVEPVTRPNVLD